MNLEPIIQSKVSQKEKNTCCILMQIYGISKDGTDDSICGLQRRDRLKEWTFGFSERSE